MGHDIGQFIIIKGIEGALIHTEHAAQAHGCIDIFIRGNVDLVIPIHCPRIAKVPIDFLHPVVRFRRIIDPGLLLALRKELLPSMVIQPLVIIGNEKKCRRPIENFLCRRSRFHFRRCCQAADAGHSQQGRCHFFLPLFHILMPPGRIQISLVYCTIFTGSVV